MSKIDLEDGQDVSHIQKWHPQSNADTQQVDGFYPNMKKKCMVCGAQGTVVGIKDGMICCDMDMCGVCCWGEAAMLDPASWNS